LGRKKEKNTKKQNLIQQKKFLISRTYRVSIKEGIFAQIYGNLANIGSSFITKFMVLLGATPMQFSILSSLGQVSAVFQPLGVALTHRLKKRKKVCIWVTGIGRFLSFFIGAAWFFSDRRMGIIYLLVLLFVSAGLQAIGGNIWIAWVSDLIPQTIRGRFFARRNQILAFAGLIAGYFFGYCTDLFEKNGGLLARFFPNPVVIFNPQNQPFFLILVFIIATILGIISLIILNKQPDRKYRVQSDWALREKFSEAFRNKNFRSLLFFGIWWMLATGVGSAFWGPFMLKKLQMSMIQLQTYNTLSIISSLLAYSFWGKFIDRYGNKTAMSICVALGGFNPMLWLFLTPQNFSLLWFEALSSGFMWSGNAIATTNFSLAIAGKGKEQTYSAIYGALGGIAMMCSTLLTGVFFPAPQKLGNRWLEPEQVVFGIGGILRWLSIIPLLFVREKVYSGMKKKYN
jgi:MFS family permease